MGIRFAKSGAVSKTDTPLLDAGPSHQVGNGVTRRMHDAVMGNEGGYRRQWRWYRAPGSLRVVAKDEFEALPAHGRAALIDVMKRWPRGAALPREVKSLSGSGGLWELRVSVGNDPFRLVFFKDSPVHDVIVLAVYKDQRKLPRAQHDLAVSRMKIWKQHRE